MKKINCLVIAISPTHIVSSMSAILTRHSTDSVNVVILAQWPVMDDELTNELSVVMQSMLRVFSFVEPVKIVPYSTFTKRLAVSDMTSFKLWLRELVGVEHAEEIYYSHDVMGQFYQALSTVYNNARRICIGDGMGTVFERHVHLSLFEVERQSQLPTNTNKVNIFSLIKMLRAKLHIKRRLLRLFKKISEFHLKPNKAPLTGITLNDFLPQEAVLILPVDESGNFLKQVPLTVCPKKIVLDVLENCVKSCSELQSYIHSLLNDFKGKRKYLLLTESLAEGNFIDFERETEMYCQMVSNHCEPGSVVFIKSHPGETLPRNERIAERLAGDYEVIGLERAFKRYPVELWKDLVLESTVICISYPALSLKYLHDVDVICPLSVEFIESWFPQQRWAVVKNALAITMGPLKKLPEWDGKSVLWAGSISRSVLS